MHGSTWERPVTSSSYKKPENFDKLKDSSKLDESQKRKVSNETKNKMNARNRDIGKGSSKSFTSSSNSDSIEILEPKKRSQKRKKTINISKKLSPSPPSAMESPHKNEVKSTTETVVSKGPKKRQQTKILKKALNVSNASPSSVIDEHQKLSKNNEANSAKTTKINKKRKENQGELSFVSKQRYEICSLQKLYNNLTDKKTKNKQRRSQQHVMKRPVIVRQSRKMVKIVCKKY